MSTLLVRNIAQLITMDSRRQEIPGGGLFVKDGMIEQVGFTQDLPDTADHVVDLQNCLVLPGFINTHHHFYQTLTRAVKPAQDVSLFRWLQTLYPIWAQMTPQDIYISTRTALLELAFSGCTTAADHLYIFPNGSRLDDEIEAAREVGLRLHATRGSMSLGESQGGVPPDSVVESEENILKDSQRLIQKYHDPNPGSMLQIALAPCSPFSVTGELMRQSAQMAQEYKVRLHTHLAETYDEDQFCLKKFGLKPVDYVDSLGWINDSAWFAHAVHIHQGEITRFARAGCGVAHCPSSNMRLASGIAPIFEYLRAGIPVGLGVDGSASNDSSHLLAEVRQAMLLARLRSGLPSQQNEFIESASLFTARQALELATIGGAAVLGRKDIGSLEPGKCADFIAFNLNCLDFAGGLQDPAAALVFCSPQKVFHSVIHGKFVIQNGESLTMNPADQVKLHQKASKRLLENI